MKSIAKILVPVTGTESDRAVLSTAIDAGRLFNAHVEAVFAHPDPQAAVPQVGVPFSLDVVEAIVGGQEMYAKAAEAAARATLAGLCDEMGVRIVDTPCCTDSVTCSFRNEGGMLPMIVAYRARLSDLVVFPAPHLPGLLEVTEAFLNVLTGIERPVIVSAGVSTGRIARSVAIGWDGSRSAARAVSAAMPFLRGAELVHVLEVDEGRARHGGGNGIQQYLNLHDVKCTRQSLRLDEATVGETLADGAAHGGADLLVMGGYGRSHLRETIFGGVTSDVLARAQMPVFLVH